MDGLNNFVFLIDRERFDEFDSVVTRFQSILEITKEYKLTTEKNEYRIIQVTVDYPNYSRKGICRFVYTYFPFIALRQEGSTYILVSNGHKFRETLADLYTKETKLQFLYDMLSIGDRYAACIGAGAEIDELKDNRLIKEVKGNIYNLLFNSNCVHLFDHDSNIKIFQTEDDTTLYIDIINGIDIFNFHIAILK